MNDLEQLIKDNTGKCECGKEFVAWQHNWDGAYELKKCRECTQKDKEAEEKLYQDAVTKGKPSITLTEEVEGWKYKGRFFENPEYHVEVGNIDDKIRKARKEGIKEMIWDRVEFEALRYFISILGYKAGKKNVIFMGVKHRVRLT